MAVVNNPITGRSRGSVGGVTFSTWKGLNIMKEKITVMTNPRSALQQVNRARFVALLGFAKLFRPILQIGFKEYATVLSWMNRFMKTNSNNGFLTWDVDNNIWVPDFERLVISEGSLFPTIPEFTGATTTSLNIEWPNSPVNNQAENDLLFALIVTQNETKFVLGTTLRVDGSASVPLVGANIGDEVFAVVFFASNDMRIVSNSLVVSGTVTA